MTKVSDILGFIDKIAPMPLAEKWDNPGLQVGDPGEGARRIMVALDPSPKVIKEALLSGCNILVTHHPLIFKPISTISADTPLGRSIHEAIENRLSIIALHTNYDIAEGGLNDLLAEKTGLSSSIPLQVTSTRELVKLVIFVPDEQFEVVRNALLPFAKNLGNYSDCSFASDGQGTFTPLEGSTPFKGKRGELEEVSEKRLELLLDRENLSRAISKMFMTHPYEEPAFDVYPLQNKGQDIGLGRIGELPKPLSLEKFASKVAEVLHYPNLRYVGEPSKMIRRVAICSGSGASLVGAAKSAGADLLLTGDVRYHDAMHALDIGLALIDAGHFQTEMIMAESVASRLRVMLTESGDPDCQVICSRGECVPFYGF